MVESGLGASTESCLALGSYLVALARLHSRLERTGHGLQHLQHRGSRDLKGKLQLHNNGLYLNDICHICVHPIKADDLA